MARKRTAWLLNRAERTAVAAFGLFICSFGSYMQVQAGIGLSPWNALNQGVQVRFAISYGTAASIISAGVILLDLALKEGVGIGSVLDTVVVGRSVDIFIKMNIFPEPDSLAMQICLLIVGMTVSAVGVDVYMRGQLCCGPRDTLMVALGKRFRRIPIGAVNSIILALVMLLAILLGCVIGIGTVIATFVNGPILQFVFWMTRFDPCGVKHENFLNMVRSYRAINAEGSGLR